MKQSQENVAHIWKQGFPDSTDHKEAAQEAEANARSQVEGLGRLLSLEIIQTPEHEANNEFLVKLVFAHPEE